MAIDDKHPEYQLRIDDWLLLSDTFEGERVVKAAGTDYLPATRGMIEDGFLAGNPNNEGRRRYDAYRTRAQVPSYVRDAVEMSVGVMHREEPTIELPARLEPMRRKATSRGEPLVALLRHINAMQLKHGRIVLVGEVPDGAGPNAVPYIAAYAAPSMINWQTDDRGNFLAAVFDESGLEMQPDLSWKNSVRHRVMLLDGEGASARYRAAVVEDKRGVPPTEDMIEPQIAGRSLDRLPIVVANKNDLAPDPDVPPLLGLAQDVVSLYRLDADHKTALFMTAQDTLVRTGIVNTAEKPAVALGAGAVMDLPPGADAKFVGVTSTGLKELADKIDKGHARATQRLAKLLDQTGSQAESGQALRIRVEAKTATLRSIALTGAEALAEILRILAVWVGANPDEVVIEPNTDFADHGVKPADLKALVEARNLDERLLSQESMHKWLQDHDFTELDFETEQQKIDEDIVNYGAPEPPGEPVDPSAAE